jgi:protein-L-isoaspartate(D-aspartate) O-methyltransferase
LSNTNQDTYKHKGLRNRLVATLKSKGISETAVLDAISMIPRHFFLPHEFESHAYDDKPFPIGEGQTISQPYTVAYQTQLLNLKPACRVLEVGTGSGYQAAVLLACGARVFSIERHKKLSDSAARTLKLALSAEMLSRLSLFSGDGTRGLPAHAPYDRIIVTAGAPSVPKALVSQLVDGGILVIPVGKEVQKMVRITKLNEKDIKTELFADFNFVPLVGENGWKEE